MRIAIIQFPGSNNEREIMLAVKRAGMEPIEFLWNEPKEQLANFSGYIIVGGFSYEDRARAGVIAGLDPLMGMLKQQSALGKPILGICNGAQILVESGLVPGLEHHKVGMVLTDNKRIQEGKVLGTGFYNAWVDIRLSDMHQANAFTRYLKPADILNLPVAHAQGRFVIPPGLLAEMQENGLNVFQYCDAKGQIIDEFPVNPNGSINNIAAVSNKAGNVLAMMPHPERTENGDAIFQSMREYIANGVVERVAPLHYHPRACEIKPYRLPATSQELVIDLIITDNHAKSVESALNHLGIPVKIKRQVHWEIICDSPATTAEVIKSGVLYNDRKEMVTNRAELKSPQCMNYLVRAKEDMIGQQKKQMLKNHFGIPGVIAIHHSIIWQIAADSNLADYADQVIASHILFNPYAHDCYYY